MLRADVWAQSAVIWRRYLQHKSSGQTYCSKAPRYTTGQYIAKIWDNSSSVLFMQTIVLWLILVFQVLNKSFGWLDVAEDDIVGVG